MPPPPPLSPSNGALRLVPNPFPTASRQPPKGLSCRPRSPGSHWKGQRERLSEKQSLPSRLSPGPAAHTNLWCGHFFGWPRSQAVSPGLGCCVSRGTGMVAYKEPPAASSKSHPIPTTLCPRDGESHSPCTLETATRNESQDRVG